MRRRPYTPPTSWRQVAARRWPGAAWISGSGRFAVVAPCGHLTASLWHTQDEARRTWRGLASSECGSACNPARHVIIDLASGVGGLALAVRDAKRRLRAIFPGEK
jgi:hypothetical protein